MMNELSVLRYIDEKREAYLLPDEGWKMEIVAAIKLYDTCICLFCS